jgi:sugar diacid utilization regulator
MKPNEMKPEEIEIIKAMAECDLNVTTTAKELNRHRGTVMYWIEKLKKETGLDCRKFYDLVKLVGMVEDGNTQD